MQPRALPLSPTPRGGDAAARVPQPDVPDVVGAGADDLADDVAVAVERRARARGRLRRREAGRRPARPVRQGHVRRGVEVELVGVADQDHPDRRLVLVDLRDAVDQRDLGRGDVGGAAVVGGVGRVRGQREPEGVQLDLGAGERGRGLDLRRELVGLPLDEALVVGEVAGEVAEIDVVVVALARVDEVGAVLRAHRGVEAELGDVGADRRRAVVDAAARPGLDVRVLGGQLGLHDRRLVDVEALEAAVRLGHREHDRAGRPRARARLGRRGQARAQRALVQA